MCLVFSMLQEVNTSPPRSIVYKQTFNYYVNKTNSLLLIFYEKNAQVEIQVKWFFTKFLFHRTAKIPDIVGPQEQYNYTVHLKKKTNMTEKLRK